MKTTFYSDELLSLVFFATNINNKITDSDIISFIDKFMANIEKDIKDSGKTFSFYMPMNENFNTLHFRENEDGTYEALNKKMVRDIAIYVINNMEEARGSLLNTMADYNEDYKKVKVRGPLK